MGYFVADNGISTGNVIVGTSNISATGTVTVGTDLRVTGNAYIGSLMTSVGTVWGAGVQEKQLYQPGTLIATNGKARWYPPVSITINQIKALLVVPCAGQPANINVNKNSIAVTSVSIPATSNVFAYSNVSITVTPSDYITVDVIQAGNVSPGSDLHVLFYY